jgi:hypothetical protein
MFSKKTAGDADVAERVPFVSTSTCRSRIDPVDDTASVQRCHLRIIDHGARVILMSHLGGPPEPDPRYSLGRCAAPQRLIGETSPSTRP